MEDFGVQVEGQANMDSSAAKSIDSRRGAGRVPRIGVWELWVQNRVAKDELTVVKVKGESHVADGLAQHVERHKMDQHMRLCGVVRRGGRHELGPYLGDA